MSFGAEPNVTVVLASTATPVMVTTSRPNGEPLEG